MYNMPDDIYNYLDVFNPDSNTNTCPECGAELIVEGDKYSGYVECTECDFNKIWGE